MKGFALSFYVLKYRIAPVGESTRLSDETRAGSVLGDDVCWLGMCVACHDALATISRIPRQQFNLVTN